MIRRLAVIGVMLALLGSLPVLGGCAAPTPRGGTELGEVRGGSGNVVYKDVPWAHPAWGP